MSSGRWEPGDVAAVIANPFYAIEIHKSFGRSHEHVLSEARWIASNERAVGEVGARQWLAKLMLALKTDHARGSVERGPLIMADPYPAITVAPMLCVEHPPMVAEDLWLKANATGLEEHGAAWLRNLVRSEGVYPAGDSSSPEN